MYANKWFASEVDNINKYSMLLFRTRNWSQWSNDNGKGKKISSICHWFFSIDLECWSKYNSRSMSSINDTQCTSIRMKWLTQIYIFYNSKPEQFIPSDCFLNEILNKMLMVFTREKIVLHTNKSTAWMNKYTKRN
jgi:hypothetical protein